MGLKVTSLDQLDPELVTQLHAEFSQLVQERHPEVELTRGVMHDLVHYFAGGVSGGINQTEVQRVLDSRSLLAIETNPELADPELTDHVLSNYGISRKTGTTSQGEITIVVQGGTTVVIPANAAYLANGVVFRVDEPFIAKPPGSLLLEPTDRLLEPRGDGTFDFTISATAELTGESGNIRRGTKLVPESPINRFVTAFAAVDFTGGTTTETNTELLKRMQLGIAAPVMQGRINIEALIKSQATFSDTLHYSIIGYGNPEMSRDQHWIFPVSGGGRMDIYARTNGTPVTVVLRKTAVLVEKLAGGSTWQFSINKNEAPGFYEVTQVLLPDDPTDIAGFEVTFDQRGYDLSGDDFLPDITQTVEAAYSRYQTAVIRFLDTETDVAELSLGDTAEYVVAVSTMPLIRQLQDFCSGNGVRNLMSDVLIKATVPCFLSINANIEQAAGETAPDLDTIKNEMANQINALNFPGQLHSSLVAEIIHNYLTRRQAVGPIDLHGRIRRPDGTVNFVRHSQVLVLPESPSTLVTGRTTSFFIEPQDIGLQVVTKGFSQNV